MLTPGELDEINGIKMGISSFTGQVFFDALALPAEIKSEWKRKKPKEKSDKL